MGVMNVYDKTPWQVFVVLFILMLLAMGCIMITGGI